MAAVTVKPTSHYASNQINNPANIYDNDESTFAKAQYNNRAILVYGFDTSVLAPDLRNGARITDIKFYIRARAGGTATVRMVRDAVSTSEYTDCGDEAVEYPTFPSEAGWFSRSFPNAVSYWNENTEAFLNGGLQVHIYMKSSVTLYYECYAEIEYSLPESNIYIGTKRVSAYVGTKKASVYCGTKKLI